MPDKAVWYVIQQKHWLFFWVWVDASVNTSSWCKDKFVHIEDAIANKCWFDGTKRKEEIMTFL